jgi:DNA polymerase I-like protein with 3'-5' exonuclease and polymerase domains
MSVQKGKFDKCPQPPVPEYNANRKRWRLVAQTFTRPSDKRAKIKHSGCYTSKEAAQEDVQYWRDVLRGVAASPPMKPVTLNASAESKKKGLKLLRVRVSRREFKELYAHYDDAALARWVRRMQRRRDDLSQSNAKWLSSMSGRKERLENMLSNIKEILRCFKEAQMKGTVIKYILAEEEDLSRAKRHRPV